MDPLTIKLLARLFSPEMLDNLLQQSRCRGFNKLCRTLQVLGSTYISIRSIFSFITYSKYIDSTQVREGLGVGKLQR